MDQLMEEWLRLGEEISAAGGGRLKHATRHLIVQLLADSRLPKNLSNTLTEMLTRIGD